MAGQEVVVVGGGLSGLSLAAELGNAIVVETRDNVGGFFANDELPVNGVAGRQLVQSLASKVKALTRLTAFQVEQGGVWVVGEEGAKLLRGLVVGATGFREKTAVELGITGYRPAGMWYLTAAWDLVNMGYSLGSSVLVYGLNHFSLALVQKLRGKADRVYIAYDEPSLVHAPEVAVEMGAEVLKGRVKRIEGLSRVERVKGVFGELRVDSLVLAVPAPWNPLGSEMLAGNAAIVIEDPSRVVELSRIIAQSLRAGGEAAEVLSSAPVYPRRVPWSVGRTMVAAPRGARIRIGDRVVEAEEPYPVVEVPRERKVRIEVV
ncbi:MAG: hypothetical protein ABWK01_04620 [Infirmifilum sp.]